MIKRATAFAAAMLIAAGAFAADDASIRGELRADIKQAMAEHVAASSSSTTTAPCARSTLPS